MSAFQCHLVKSEVEGNIQRVRCRNYCFRKLLKRHIGADQTEGSGMDVKSQG